MSETTATITIDRGLYDELRSYCDANGIRFKDFIEESLETATYRDEMARLRSDDQRLRERIDLIKEGAIRLGFVQGVMASTLNLEGYAEIARRVTPEAARDEVDFRPVTGGQMSLFDGTGR